MNLFGWILGGGPPGGPRSPVTFFGPAKRRDGLSIEPTRRIDAYLTRKAQEAWPDAVVYQAIETGVFILTRSGQEPLSLGSRFTDAKSALSLLAKSQGHK